MNRWILLIYTVLLASPAVYAKVESPIFRTALPLLIIPVGFRLTCYYFRGWYGKHVLGRPKGCALASHNLKPYTGEWWIQKLHRYFLYGAILLLILHIYDTIHNLVLNSGHIYISNLLEIIDVILLSLYVLSCHSLRYKIGSICSRCTSLYKGQTTLNLHHGLYFWLSIGSILFLELYIRLLQWGVISDLKVF